MENKKYERKSKKNDAEKARINREMLEELLFSSEERNSTYYQLKYGGEENGK